jgi:hypothetical protein
MWLYAMHLVKLMFVPFFQKIFQRSVLAWPAWFRVLVLLPVVLLLWLAVGWANMDVAPW